MNAPPDTSRRYSQRISTVLRLCQIKVIREQLESHLTKQNLKLEIDQLRETYNESVEQLHLAEKLIEELSTEKIRLMSERRSLSKRCQEVGKALKDARHQADWFTAQRKSIQEKLREVAADATRERIRNERTKEQLQEEQRKQLELENFLKAGPHSFRGLVPDAAFGEIQIGPAEIAADDYDDEQQPKEAWNQVLLLIAARQRSLDTNVQLYERLQSILGECRSIKLQVDELESERNKRQSVLVKKKLFLEGRVVMPGDESRPTCCLRRVPTHRVRVIGADGVGKSCLIHQLIESEDLCSYQNIVTTPDSSSDTLPELPKTRLILDDEESELVFEETHKSEVTAQDLIETDAFLIVYSMADGESYEFAESILGRLSDQDLLRKAIIVVANKDDLNRCKVITIKDGRTLAEQHKSKYATISAFIGHKTNHLLVGTLRQIRLIEKVETVQTAKKRLSNLPIIQLPEGDILDPNDQSISSNHWMCGDLFDMTKDFLYSVWNKCFVKNPRQCENLNVL
ncbi:uncharacterized protein LOC108863835 [Galendromus occidentalis]|uniref:Uncharacterized protein LOC108863835 n=1 Tax=Galendromus occidentalis TaxID=34638 RepID=A0AAJ7SEN5_9ACAR|nr:uncharacterized protein LOC108863835 [Galendromus occidentalis]